MGIRKISNVYNENNTRRYYETFGAEVESFSESDQFFLNLIPENLQGKVALDLGAGNGKHSELLHNRGAEEVIVLDSSESMILEAEKRKQEKQLHRLSLLLADLDDIPIHEKRIDFILSRFSVMYSSNLPALIQKLCEILKDEGEMLIQANFAIIKEPTIEKDIKSAPVTLHLQTGKSKVVIKNYANTLEDYYTAFYDKGLTVHEKQEFPADELSVSKKYRYSHAIDFKYIVFQLRKNR